MIFTFGVIFKKNRSRNDSVSLIMMTIGMSRAGGTVAGIASLSWTHKT